MKIKKAEALAIIREARSAIAYADGSYICCQISAAAERLGHGRYDRNHPLRLRVMDSLGDSETFEDWLQSRGLKHDRDSARAARVAFLDKWIEAIERSNLP